MSCLGFAIEGVTLIDFMIKKLVQLTVVFEGSDLLLLWKNGLKS